MQITAEQTRQALLAHTSLENGYEKLQKYIACCEELTINQKIEQLTQLQRVYEAMCTKKAV